VGPAGGLNRTRKAQGRDATLLGMDTIARNRDLRVCATCWSTVHRDEITEHDRWHEHVRRDALAEALRLLQPERVAS
jgi:hypothetical protein